VAVDPQGNVTAVWTQAEDSEGRVWSNRYPAAGPWGTAGRIDTEATGSGGSLDVAVDSIGNVIVVWRQVNAGIWVNRYPSAGPWGTPVLISAANAIAFGPRVAVDPLGNATAVWSQEASPDGRRDIWSSRFE